MGGEDRPPQRLLRPEPFLAQYSPVPVHKLQAREEAIRVQFVSLCKIFINNPLVYFYNALSKRATLVLIKKLQAVKLLTMTPLKQYKPFSLLHRNPNCDLLLSFEKILRLQQK